MPTVDWVLLGSGERPTRDRILAAFTAASLQTHLASRQEKRVTIIIIGAQTRLLVSVALCVFMLHVMVTAD
jgi:hypothetical protein